MEISPADEIEAGFAVQGLLAAAKRFAALSVFSLVLAISCRAEETMPICLPVGKAMQFDPELRVPRDLQGRSLVFRREWEGFCAARLAGKKTSGKSLYDMILEAYDLGLEFDAFVDFLGHRLHLQRFKEDHVRRINKTYERLQAIASLLPMFETVLPFASELPYVRPSEWLFRLHAGLGDAQDQAFLRSPVTLFDWSDRPWTRKAPDTINGDCLLAGEFGAVELLERTQALRPRLVRQFYRDRLEEFEGSLFENFVISRKRPFVCTCGDPAGFKEDFRKLLHYANRHDDLAIHGRSLVQMKYWGNGEWNRELDLPVFNSSSDRCRGL